MKMLLAKTLDEKSSVEALYPGALSEMFIKRFVVRHLVSNNHNVVGLAGSSAGPGAALVAWSLGEFPSLLVLFKFLLLLKIRFTF